MAKERRPAEIPPADNPTQPPTPEAAEAAEAAKSPLKPKDPVIARALAEVWSATEPFERGQTIPWELIESAIGFPRNHSKTKTLVEKIKKKYEKERFITIWAEPTVGLRLLTKTEQLTWAVEKRTRRARKQISKGLGHLQAIPDEELTSHERQLRASKVQGHRRLRRQVNQTRKQDEAMNRPTNGNRPFR